MKNQKQPSPQEVENTVESTVKKSRKRKKVKKKKQFNKRNKYLHLVLNKKTNCSSEMKVSNLSISSEIFTDEIDNGKLVKPAGSKKHKKKPFQKLKLVDESKACKNRPSRKERKNTKKKIIKTNDTSYKIRKLPLFDNMDDDDDITLSSFNETLPNAKELSKTETTEDNLSKTLDSRWKQTPEQFSELDNDADLESMPCMKKSKHKRVPSALYKSKDILQRSQSLKRRMLEHLKSSQFRYINEKLYSCTGKEARKIFGNDLSYEDYHTGYQNQVAKWPVHPLKLIIEDILSRSPKLVVADFGCGDATIAKSVPNKVHSFDLVAMNSHVIACNMARVPLQNEGVDVVVFCLSLMGTNLSDYIREGHRVLRMGGTMKIAEIESRFEDVNKFVTAIEHHGFQLISKDENFKMFILFEFLKSRLKPKKKMKCELSLKPCLYKKR